MEAQLKKTIVERACKMANNIGNLFRLVPVDEGNASGESGESGENLTQQGEPATLEPSTAAGETAEDTGNIAAEYRDVIAQQNALISTMKEQNERLNGQIVELMKSGAQIRDTPPAQVPQTRPAQREENVPTLSDLGKLIGKPNVS